MRRTREERLGNDRETAIAVLLYGFGATIMDFLRAISWGTLNDSVYPGRAAILPSNADYDDLGTILHDEHLRRDIARRPDLTKFVRDEKAA